MIITVEPHYYYLSSTRNFLQMYVFTSKIRLQFNTDILSYFKHTTHCYTLKRNILSCEQEMLSSPTLKENRSQSKISLIKWFMLKTFEVWDIYLLNRVSWQ